MKAIVMITVAIAWLAYMGTELARGNSPDVWTWGILTGVYAALYQPWPSRRGGGGQSELPGPRPGPKRLAREPDTGADDEE